MRDYRDVIIAPVVTEQSMKELEDHNKYTFKVNKKTNKFEVKNAIQNLFNVKVTGVNISNTKAKAKRRGRISYTSPGYKKATVTLAEGDKIQIFQNPGEEE